MDIKNGAGFFRALGDETRIRIVLQLASGEQCACALIPVARKSQPTVSSHLKILEQAGILSSRKKGKNVWYRLNDQNAAGVLKTIGLKPIKAPANC